MTPQGGGGGGGLKNAGKSVDILINTELNPKGYHKIII